MFHEPQGKRAASVEASPDWVCVNYDEGVVAHFFTPDRRDRFIRICSRNSSAWDRTSSSAGANSNFSTIGKGFVACAGRLIAL